MFEAGSVDPCHRLLMLKFIHLLDDAGYSIEKVNGTKTSVHIGQFSTDHAIATTHMRPEHRSRFHIPNSLLYHFNLHDPNVSLDVTCSSYLEASHMAVQCLRRDEVNMAVCGVDRRFFNRSNLDPPLLIGSIKSNLGHTEGAAGVLSLIKVAMCMYHRGITANMQFTSLNPKIEVQKCNPHILQNFVPFPTLSNNEKVAIGVNSFGMGGITTHAIIEEYQSNKTSIENGHIDNGNHIKSK
ncbi:unnamed protein product [Adineta steineri]|uniref:Ketosynthase family 3 (KS3) domain-containing protein n=1 Tax=Adineta steineri TaxID=433720 RepID=A0A819CBK9_9BILA|nr:unnamed protein product [Adineta steineri]CAF1252797.1 unnamed protein product [Adineta steineri]CAF1459627.1 unnamed protein product [Adineta steineri]CAF3818028.1 unnamed protein product [Adineta steineri]CAF4052364.1 unnamed protein product [Adineta steineri]